MIQLSQEDLSWAAERGLLRADDVAPLWSALVERTEARRVTARFDPIHLAYYFGALLIIFAMGFFLTIGWESFGGAGICAIATTYIFVFVLVGRELWNRQLKVPGGLCITIAVSIAPLAIYGLERALGVWPDHDPGSYHDFHEYVRGGWIWMELGGVLAGLIALRSFRFPFITMPIALVLWYLSMDLTPIFFGVETSWNQRAAVSAVVGALILVIAWMIDRRTEEDFAFWIYLAGMLAFWGGLSAMESQVEWHRLVYLAINLLLIVLAIPLERTLFVIFGGFGVFGYLAYESWHTFRDSTAFPFALTAIGLLILLGAVKFAQRRAAIAQAVNARIPAWLERYLPRSRVRAA
jgi:hypothetical protein